MTDKIGKPSPAETARGEQNASPAPDVAAYKALAHPDRLRMLGMLRFDGPATATSLAKRLGLNSGATSYHLRQLAQHGLIEEAEALGNKRDRWWQARRDDARNDPLESPGAAPDAALDMVAAVYKQHQDAMQNAIMAFPSLPDAWKATANISDYTLALTAEEALDFKEKLIKLLWDAVKASPADGDHLDPGKRHYTIMLHAFPFSMNTQESDEDGSS